MPVLRRFSIPLCRAVVPAMLALVVLPAALRGQAPTVQDARLPRQGELWIEIWPSVLSWSEQFALDSEGVSDGSREPLTADFEGPITDRLFPDDLVFLNDINGAGTALGYDPLTPEELSFGDLDYRDISRQVRQIPIALRIGILDRLSLEVMAPLVQTRTESFLDYDSLPATVTSGMAAIANSSDFFDAVSVSQDELAALIAGGTLTPEEMAIAEALLANSTAFSTTLEQRVMANSFIPVGGSTAGMQMTATYSGFVTGYESFGLTLPALELAEQASAQDLDALLASPQLAAQPLVGVTRGWDIGELEVGLRIGLFDTFVPITRFGEPTPAEAGAAAEREDDRGEPLERGAAVQALARRPPSVQFRTTVGGKARFPLKEPNGAPYLDPSDFLGVPIGNGTTDFEISLFQDVRFKRSVLVLASFYYGIQLADDVDLRVHSPDRPLALAETLSSLRRELGNYFEVRLAPQFLLNDVLAIGLEYNYWNKGSDTYTLISSEGGIETAEPLELETSQTRNTLGVGAYYRTQDLVESGRTSVPIEVGLIFQSAIAGSGGQTPAAQRFTAYFRLPFKLF